MKRPYWGFSCCLYDNHHGDIEEGEEEDRDQEEDNEGDLMDWVPLKHKVYEINKNQHEYLWYVQHGTKGRLWCWGSVGIGEGDEVDPELKVKTLSLVWSLLGEEEVGDAGKHGNGPTERGDDGGSFEIRERKDVEGPTDGQVALQGEGDDGQDVGVGGRLREERTQTAKLLAKGVRVLVPEDGQLVGKACKMDWLAACIRRKVNAPFLCK